MSKKPDPYYQSHNKLGFIGTEGQTKLSGAKVLVIGAGGLGCPCLLTLATAGIGIIGVDDFDTVSLSNLHRQVLYNFNDIDEPKCKIAAKRLLQHNPDISVNQHHIRVDDGNVIELISQYDIIVDGTDNFAVRYLINDACIYLGKPLVYGAIYQAEGHVTVFNYKGSATLRCLFPEPNAETYVPSCAEVGAYNVVTNVIGTLMANEIIKLILGMEDVLADKLLTFDALTATTRTISYHKKKDSTQKSMHRFEPQQQPLTISAADFLQLEKGTYQLIDVREEWERDEFNIGGMHVPVDEIINFNTAFFTAADKLICYCAQGVRSATAAQYLRKLGFVNAVSLQGGVNSFKGTNGISFS